MTGRQGSSRGYSLVRGWQPPFPETSGYIIGTLLDYGKRTGLQSLADRAADLGNWEIDVQNPDGGVIEGLLTGQPKPSIVFNTGMVIHGWLDLCDAGISDRWLAPAERAGGFLVRNQRQDGTWIGEADYFRIPHTYNARVSWALIRLARATGEPAYVDAACRQLRWVLSKQRPNGWFVSCNFKPGRLPNTHAIAYTLRGLLESYLLTFDDAYLAAVRKTADALAGVMADMGWLPATFDAEWRPRSWYECLTGTAQLGGVWLRLYQCTGDERYLPVGLRAIDRAASRQMRRPGSPIHGALPGSFPIVGRYAPLSFPNWATKFLVDALLLRDDVTARLSPDLRARLLTVSA